jgi:dTDP-4-amino-4,6-dideoxygalactose transaminase
MWVRKRIEIGWSDIAFGLVRSLRPADRAAAQLRLERFWSSEGDALACFSVRTGFDLLLDALQLPHGSHVLMSSVNIRDMVQIVEHHGLVPVPVDLDAATMAPTAESVARAITPAAKGIVIAHLFGGRISMDPIVELAKEHGLLVIEDCAQAFDGGTYRGHPDGDVSMFSFGPIKSSSALGGAILRVRDAELRRRMRDRQAGYPGQSRWTYFRRLVKYVGIRILSARLSLALVVRVFRLLRLDYDRIAANSARGFAGPNFFERIRRQPSAVLLAVLERRLRRFDLNRLTNQRSKAAMLLDRLNGNVGSPGVASTPHTFWVFPIVVGNPEHVAAALRQAGFDATQRQSLCLIPPPSDLPELGADTARMVIDRIVYLPLCPEMREADVERMADIVVREAKPTVVDRSEPLAVQELSRG